MYEGRETLSRRITSLLFAGRAAWSLFNRAQMRRTCEQRIFQPRRKGHASPVRGSPVQGRPGLAWGSIPGGEIRAPQGQRSQLNRLANVFHSLPYPRRYWMRGRRCAILCKAQARSVVSNGEFAVEWIMHGLRVRCLWDERATGTFASLPRQAGRSTSALLKAAMQLRDFVPRIVSHRPIVSYVYRAFLPS